MCCKGLLWSAEIFPDSQGFLNRCQLSVALHIEASHLFCRAKQMTGFYMKPNTDLKRLNPLNNPLNPSYLHYKEMIQFICVAELPGFLIM